MELQTDEGVTGWGMNWSYTPGLRAAQIPVLFRLAKNAEEKLSDIDQAVGFLHQILESDGGNGMAYLELERGLSRNTLEACVLAQELAERKNYLTLRPRRCFITPAICCASRATSTSSMKRGRASGTRNSAFTRPGRAE